MHSELMTVYRHALTSNRRSWLTRGVLTARSAQVPAGVPGVCESAAGAAMPTKAARSAREPAKATRALLACSTLPPHFKCT